MCPIGDLVGTMGPVLVRKARTHSKVSASVRGNNILFCLHDMCSLRNNDQSLTLTCISSLSANHRHARCEVRCTAFSLDFC